MALDTLDGLKAAVAEWLNRDDLTASVPDFITLAESRINRTLRVAEMEKTAETFLTGGTASLPPDWLEPRRITTHASGAYQDALRFLTPTVAGDIYISSAGGVPRHYSISGNILATHPNGGEAVIRMTYYAAVPPLNLFGSNWLLAKAPEAYLYGACLEAAPFMLDDARLPVWAQLFQAAMDRLNAADQRARWATSVCAVAVPTP
jgi:hypothetical protein